METFLPMSVSFQRRLSRLYNDTKKSSDFVKEPVQNEEDPEIKALHRKLRIQKDRLVSWGLEWSDPGQSAEILIDTSLSKAGLSEVVGSIMSTIKDILAEAEPLWQSSRRLAGDEKGGYRSEKGGVSERKYPTVVWDKGRFEDLVRDLTTSIDTLYDLSRTRSSYAQTSQAARDRLFKSSPSTEDMRPFESSRIQTPQAIDPQTLTNLRSMQAEPMTERELASKRERPREIVFMTKQAFAELTHRGGRQPYSPLLLEYGDFNPIFSTVGIMPSMSRFEKLSAGLQVDPQRSPAAWTGMPRLLGYFEDMEHSRIGLVYQFPPTFNPVTFEHLTQNPLYNLCSLADLLARPDFEPKLEAKFRLAANLANTVFDMHARGIIHGRLVDANVSFCNAVGTEPGQSGVTTGEVDIRRPLISAFDLFPDDVQDAPPPASPPSLYRHPLDPRTTPSSPLASNPDTKTLDLYSLAMLLLSIGLWTDLSHLAQNTLQPSIPESVLEQLAIRCGTLYMKAVKACWDAVDQEIAGQLNSEQVVARVQLKASRYLEACCILDGVSGLEERLSDDLGDPSAAAAAARRASLQTAARSSSLKGKESKRADRSAPPAEPAVSSMPAEPAQPPAAEARAVRTPRTERRPRSASSKTRLYPQVQLPAEAVEQWNKVLMPQVDRALRSFYRKNAKETVEISLESIGESPLRTQPTVLVICTSVHTVRNVLKRKLGALFDGSSGFALKVCQGRVVRSRNQGVERSMARAGGDDDESDDEIAAANGDFQQRPHPGASIGAWIGHRHLPPVSFGGLIMVDDRPYGMTVHHMLDDPEQVYQQARGSQDNERSMAGAGLPDLAAWYAESTAESSGGEDYACEFDSDSDTASESAITSEYGSEDSDEEEGQYGEPGDIPGIEPGCGDGYIVTQPARDDVDDAFYASAETENEDHLSSYSLGEVYASSGIRRRSDKDGLVHEIDWALFEFHDNRLPDGNVMPRAPGARGKALVAPTLTPRTDALIYPMAVAPASRLPGLEVQCIARTSGLQTGLILPALTSVKIFGRTSPSHTYQVSGAPALRQRSGEAGAAGEQGSQGGRALPTGIPGDSGAWIVDREQGQLCGHVLAWSERKRVAYICPMEMLLADIAETLAATDVRLPGTAAPVHAKATASRALGAVAEEDDGDVEDEQDEWEDEALMGPRRADQRRYRGRPLPRYTEHDDGSDASDGPPMAVSRESTFTFVNEDGSAPAAPEKEPPQYESHHGAEGLSDVDLASDVKQLQLSETEGVRDNRVNVP